MAVINYEPDRFTSTGISHRFQVTPLDTEDKLGVGLMFNTTPFGSAVMPPEDLQLLVTWINEYGPKEGETDDEQE